MKTEVYGDRRGEAQCTSMGALWLRTDSYHMLYVRSYFALEATLLE